jgi:hypothetical protein
LMRTAARYAASRRRHPLLHDPTRGQAGDGNPPANCPRQAPAGRARQPPRTAEAEAARPRSPPLPPPASQPRGTLPQAPAAAVRGTPDTRRSRQTYAALASTTGGTRARTAAADTRGRTARRSRSRTPHRRRPSRPSTLPGSSPSPPRASRRWPRSACRPGCMPPCAWASGLAGTPCCSSGLACTCCSTSWLRAVRSVRRVCRFRASWGASYDGEVTSSLSRFLSDGPP